MLEIKDLDIDYGDKQAVRDFDLSVDKGDIVSIVGESGSGKSTVIRAVLGLLPGDGKVCGGEIDYEGKDLTTLDPKSFGELRGPEISMIFQDTGAMLNPTQSIGRQFIEYIRTHSDLSKEEARQRAEEILREMNFKDPASIMSRYPFELSGGQRQRVGIAMGMVFEPKLLLADEPTSALDVTTQKQIVELMKELRDKHGTTIILITHNLGLATDISDKVVVMKDGRIVESGDRVQIVDEPKSAYTKHLLECVPRLEGE